MKLGLGFFTFLLILFISSSVFSLEEQFFTTQSSCVIDISSVTFNENTRELTTNFVIINSSDNILDSLKYFVYLQKEGSTKDYIRFDATVSESIGKNPIRVIGNFVVPNSVDASNYNAMIQVYSSNVNFCGFNITDSHFSITGNGTYLSDLNGYLVSDERYTVLFDGIPFSGEKDFSIRFPLKENQKLNNLINSGKSVSGNITIFLRNSPESIYATVENKELVKGTDSNGDYLEYIFVVPKNNIPLAGGYDITLDLFSENNLVGKVFGRWVVSGFSARISDINISSETNLSLGKGVDISVDSFFEFGENQNESAIIVLEFFDGNKLVETLSKTITPNSYVYNTSFRDVSSSVNSSFDSVRATIYSSDKSKVFDSVTKRIPKKAENVLDISIIILLIVIILVILGAMLVLTKKKVR